MSITLSGTYTSFYDLTNPATQNPLTIATTGLIDVNSAFPQEALFTGEAAPWTITNAGTITGSIVGGVGITILTNGGATSIENTGTIDIMGTNSGGINIDLTSSPTTASVTVNNDGIITASYSGIQIAEFSSFESSPTYSKIVNNGTIAMTGDYSAGIFMGGGLLILTV